jgi:hypothetical protein
MCSSKRFSPFLKDSLSQKYTVAFRCSDLDIPTISGLVATASIIVGVVFTLLEIRHFNKTRKTEIIMKIYEKFGSKEIVEAMNRVGASKFESFNDYSKKYGLTDITEIAVLFDGIGVLLEQNLIDIKMVDQLFGTTIYLLWSRIDPVIHAMREGLNEPSFFAHFENLINKLNIHRKKK